MEIKSEDIKAFLSQQLLSKPDYFGQIFRGHIPAKNRYGLEEMDVAIRVSMPRKGERKKDLELQFQNVLKLRDCQHQNIVRLVGYSKTEDNFYLVYEMIHGRPLSELINGLTWEQVLKVIQGIVSGLSYLHNHTEKPFVHSNICLNNILVTKDFVPKIIDFRHCVFEGQSFTYHGRRYYYSPAEGPATVESDVFAFGLLALQLITKDVTTAFTVEEGGSGVSLHHILDLYISMLREKGNLVHSSYGQPKECRKLADMIVDCMKKNSPVTLKRFHDDLVLLSLTK